MTDKLIQIVERYFSRLRDEHGLGAGTDERSYYPALAELLNALGHELKPKILCLSDLANTGAGHPDFGLYAANQVQKGEPRKGQPPERGVIEMKGVNEETWFTAESRQVSKYFGAYQLVVVSNLRAFLIVGEGPTGEAAKLEGFQLASTAKAFWEMVATPRKSAEHVGAAFGEYTPFERNALEIDAQARHMTNEELLALLGARTLDVYLNAEAYWSNVPEKVWDYALGGYQVIKKWLSYRERGVLGRALLPEEATYVSEMVRRIAAILMMGPALDANYRACAAAAQTYEALGLSREAVRERKGAKILKRGPSQKHTPATRQNRQVEKARGKRKKKPAPP